MTNFISFLARNPVETIDISLIGAQLDDLCDTYAGLRQRWQELEYADVELLDESAYERQWFVEVETQKVHDRLRALEVPYWDFIINERLAA